MDKTEVRKHLLERRRALLPAKRAQDSLLLGQNVAAFLDARGLPGNITVAVYSALPDEANLVALIAMLYANGATVAFPCAHSDYQMDFIALTAADFADDAPDFIKHPGKFFSSETCDSFHVVKPQEFDVVLVPAVGFDKARMRLGMGAGCYDRFLPKLKADCITIGVVFDEQLVEELPHDEHDLPVDYVITPSVAF